MEESPIKRIFRPLSALLLLLFCYCPWSQATPAGRSNAVGVPHFYTVCASGCDSPTIQGIFNTHSMESDDIVEVRADTVGGSKTYRETVRVSGNGTSGHPVILRTRTGDTITLTL